MYIHLHVIHTTLHDMYVKLHVWPHVYDVHYIHTYMYSNTVHTFIHHTYIYIHTYIHVYIQFIHIHMT